MKMNFSLIRLLSKEPATCLPKGHSYRKPPIPAIPKAREPRGRGPRCLERQRALAMQQGMLQPGQAPALKTSSPTRGVTTAQLPRTCAGVGVTVAPSLGPTVERVPRIPNKVMPMGDRLTSLLSPNSDTGTWQPHFWISAESQLWMFMFFQHRKSPCECPALSRII